MSDSYSIKLSIEVTKESDGTKVVSETNMYTTQPFAQMVSKADQFYALLAKLLKEK